MIPYVHVETPHALAHRVQRYAKPLFDRLDMRAYNRFEPEDSEWWLTPSAADPAYSSTKFHFGRDLDEFGGRTGLLTVGLHAEKGLGEKARELFGRGKGATWMMTRDWHWFRFLQLVQNGKLLTALPTASEVVGQPTVFEVQGSYVEDPQADFDPYSPLRRKDRAVYECGAGGELRLKWPADDGQGLLRGAPEHLTNDGLHAQLERLTRNDWAWVDVYAYALFRPFSDKAQPDLVWESERVWAQYLKRLAFAVG